MSVKQVNFIVIQDWIWVFGSVVLLGIDPFQISLIENYNHWYGSRNCNAICDSANYGVGQI